MSDPLDIVPHYSTKHLRISSFPLRFGTGDILVKRKPPGYRSIALCRIKGPSALSRENGKDKVVSARKRLRTLSGR
jgi:hypothetical protein